jgi:transcription elongation factor/antiterminator RfaH
VTSGSVVLPSEASIKRRSCRLGRASDGALDRACGPRVREVLFSGNFWIRCRPVGDLRFLGVGQQMLGQSGNVPPCAGEPIALAEGECWFVVHTLPHQEKRAQAQLENQHYRTFLPKRQKTVRHARRLSTVVAPFFPRYMFVVLDPERHQWRAINGTRGVAGLLRNGDRPCPVPPGIVETLLASAGPDSVLHLRPQFNVGDPVRLIAGPFAEQLGILDRLDDGGRVRVLLDMLGRRVPILVEGHQVGRVA